MRGADDELHAPLEGALRPLLVLGAKHPEEVRGPQEQNPDPRPLDQGLPQRSREVRSPHPRQRRDRTGESGGENGGCTHGSL